MAEFLYTVLFIVLTMLLFWILTLPKAYDLTGKFLSNFNIYTSMNGQPLISGVLLHAAILGVLALILANILLF